MRRTAPIPPTTAKRTDRGRNRGEFFVTLDGEQFDEFDGIGRLPGSILYPHLHDLHLRPIDNLIDLLEGVAELILELSPPRRRRAATRTRKIHNHSWSTPADIPPAQGGTTHPGTILENAATKYRLVLDQLRQRLADVDPKRPEDRDRILADINAFRTRLVLRITELIMRRDNLGTLRGFGLVKYELRETSNSKRAQSRTLANPETVSVYLYGLLND